MKRYISIIILSILICTGLSATVDVKLGAGVNFASINSDMSTNRFPESKSQYTLIFGYSIESKYHFGASTELTSFFDNGIQCRGIYVGGAYTLPLPKVSQNAKLHFDAGYTTNCFFNNDYNIMCGGNGIQFNMSYIYMLGKRLGVSFNVTNRFLGGKNAIPLSQPSVHVGDFYSIKPIDGTNHYWTYHCNPSLNIVFHFDKRNKKPKEKKK